MGWESEGNVESLRVNGRVQRASWAVTVCPAVVRSLATITTHPSKLLHSRSEGWRRRHSLSIGGVGGLGSTVAIYPAVAVKGEPQPAASAYSPKAHTAKGRDRPKWARHSDMATATLRHGTTVTFIDLTSLRTTRRPVSLNHRRPCTRRVAHESNTPSPVRAAIETLPTSSNQRLFLGLTIHPTAWAL